MKVNPAIVKKKESKPNMEQLEESEYNDKIAKVMRSMKTITILEYSYGLFKFQFNKGQLQPINILIKMTAFLSIAAYIFMLYINVCLTNGTFFLGSYTVIQFVPSMVVLLQYIISTFKNFSISESLLNIRIFTTIAKLDSLLRVEVLNDFYEILRSKTNLIMLIFVILHAANFVLEFLTSNKTLWLIFISYHLHMTQEIELLAFFNCVSMITYRIQLINKFLSFFNNGQEQRDVTVFIVREKNNEAQEKLNFVGRVSETNVKLRDLATMYDIIGKICLMINKAYNLKLFMILVTAFTFILVTIWQALSFYQSPQYCTQDFVKLSLWCFSTVCNLSALAFVCERLLRARNKTRILVNKIIMNYDLPKTMRVQAKAFMELVEAWPLRIYIYDMFSLDITLLLKFISVATTYLIVIIQIFHFI